MGEVVVHVAELFSAATGVRGPVHPFVLARAAGLYLLPCDCGRTRVEGTAVLFDEAHPGWRDEIVDEACGHVLRLAGALDSVESRQRLALLLQRGINLPQQRIGGEQQASPHTQ